MSQLQTINVVEVNLKIYEALSAARSKAETMTNGNRFAETYHNGRIDGFREAVDIVENILLNIKDDIAESSSGLARGSHKPDLP